MNPETENAAETLITKRLYVNRIVELLSIAFSSSFSSLGELQVCNGLERKWASRWSAAAAFKPREAGGRGHRGGFGVLRAQSVDTGKHWSSRLRLFGFRAKL